MSDRERNIKAAVASYEAMLNGRNIDEAASYFGPHYIQHNPYVPDGIEGWRDFMTERVKQNPDSRGEIKRVFADGDFVIMHVHMIPSPGHRGRAAVEIFRMEEGKIVEHWDVIQSVPENPANTNTMF